MGRHQRVTPNEDAGGLATPHWAHLVTHLEHTRTW